MAYGKSNDLAIRTKSDKVLRDKACGIASDPKYDGYQIGVASMVCKFFDEISSGSGVATVPKYQLQMNFLGRLLDNLREKMFIILLEAVFGVLISLICNH